MSQRLAHAPPQSNPRTHLDKLRRGLINIDKHLRIGVGGRIQLNKRGSKTQTRDAASAKGEGGGKERVASAGDIMWLAKAKTYTTATRYLGIAEYKTQKATEHETPQRRKEWKGESTHTPF